MTRHEDTEWCRFIAEIEAGILEPYFEDVPDGYYTQRVVLDGPIAAGPITEAIDWANVQVAQYHLEPCRIPRFRKELRYRRSFA